MTAYHEQHVVDNAAAAPVEATVTTRRTTMGPGQILGGLAGLALTLVGVLAVVRSGIDSSLTTPVVDVFGLQQSALVGAVEILAGLLIVAGAASVLNRSLLGFMGALVFVAGIFIAAASSSILEDLGTTKSSGTFMIVIGVVSMVAAMLPVMSRVDSRASTHVGPNA
ncbi:MAG: hypothetical protein GX868_13250 [Actinobacteria bacterium]|nr:hypothetical protein [Actinomycetota bacterium]